ncbi:hypothetical protein [Desulfosporosinus youngiae]|uniref:Uncharacterized protein n=1 Tax=Desulfosporosinus youngiae DSM 17734 TaxID=768710 RepID=H5XU75_9FIRM|nr:hypothetical protein [Desulfosporosinus youngiae]EHQ89171.1 hypothetical protein DesyoDRAFT_2077 [Desulfosporosinus youngiae DSM 17734]
MIAQEIIETILADVGLEPLHTGAKDQELKPKAVTRFNTLL